MKPENFQGQAVTDDHGTGSSQRKSTYHLLAFRLSTRWRMFCSRVEDVLRYSPREFTVNVSYPTDIVFRVQANLYYLRPLSCCIKLFPPVGSCNIHRKTSANMQYGLCVNCAPFWGGLFSFPHLIDETIQIQRIKTKQSHESQFSLG